MDLNKLIENAVQNALKHSNVNPSDGFNPISSSGFSQSTLFILCGGINVDLNGVINIINSVPGNKYIAASKSFFKMYPGFASGINNAVILNDEDYYNVFNIVNKVSAVEIPVFSLNTAAKISALISDNLVCNLILTSLFAGKRVSASSKYIIPGNYMPNGRLQTEIDNIINKLSGFGLAFSDYVSSYSNSSTGNLNNSYSNSCSLSPEECLSCGQCINRRTKDVKDLIDAGVVRVGATLPTGEVPSELARFIDHTLLKPESTEEQIISLCKEADKYGFASVCVNPGYVKLSAEILSNSTVKVCTVIGFPLGATTTETKVFEAENSIKKGADEIDMVINVGLLKSKNYMAVERDIREVANKVKQYGKILKVILETSLLSNEEIVMASSLSKSAGAHYVKTATGFGPGGATAEHIALMRKTVGENIGVKASGGIRNTDTAIEMIKAGATRIGASASVAIVEGKDAGKGKY